MLEALHNSTWEGLGKAPKDTSDYSTFLFLQDTQTRVCVSVALQAQYKQCTVTFECADCPLVGRRTGDVSVEKDDLMIDLC